MNEADLFDRDSDSIRNALVFKGTQIPVSILFDNLVAGLSVVEIVENVPEIDLDRAKATIILGGERLVEYYHAR